MKKEIKDALSFAMFIGFALFSVLIATGIAIKVLDLLGIHVS